MRIGRQSSGRGLILDRCAPSHFHDGAFRPLEAWRAACRILQSPVGRRYSRSSPRTNSNDARAAGLARILGCHCERPCVRGPVGSRIMRHPSRLVRSGSHGTHEVRTLHVRIDPDYPPDPRADPPVSPGFNSQPRPQAVSPTPHCRPDTRSQSPDCRERQSCQPIPYLPPGACKCNTSGLKGRPGAESWLERREK